MQTRKVQIKALNESKHVSAIIYVTTVILIVLVIVTFTVTKYLNLAEVCISGLLLTGTTTFLAFSFIPKVIYYISPLLRAILCQRLEMFAIIIT